MTERIERELSLEALVDDVWATITADGWLADEVEQVQGPGLEHAQPRPVLVRLEG